MYGRRGGGGGGCIFIGVCVMPSQAEALTSLQ